MRKNKLSIVFTILTVICIFSVAAIADQCGCRAIPVEEKVSVDETEEASKEEMSSEEAEGEQAEETVEEEISESEESAEEEETSEGQEQAEAPTIELEIYEGPIYSSSDNVCYYRIKANVTGTPNPDVEFSKDDSNGAWGELKVQINLDNPSDTYTLKANATNTEGTASDSIELSWGCTSTNSLPEITQIVWNYIKLLVGMQYEISATVVDPDGDVLNYSWSVSGGTIDDPTVNPMVWTTPSSDGVYEITLTVDDGNGGTDTRNRSATVYLPPPAEQSMELPIDEAGVIVKGVYVCTTPNNCLIEFGDIDINKPVRCFISFDIIDLIGTTITNAILTFDDSWELGDPDNLMQGLWVEVVDWGDDPADHLVLSDYDLPGIKIRSDFNDPPDPLITVDPDKLKTELQFAADNHRSRFQIRIRHRGWQTDGDNTRDSWQYPSGSIHLNVDFTGP